MELTCPKCQASMRTYERNGVHVDQCTDCRGIFLDRGELERLVEAENAWHGGRDSASPPPPQQQQPTREAQGLGAVVSDVLQGHGQHRGRGDQHYGQQYGGYPRKKKKSFLDELFD